MNQASVRAARAASGAVSARSTRGPSVVGAKPCCTARASSAALRPPSGPERNHTGGPPRPRPAAGGACLRAATAAGAGGLQGLQAAAGGRAPSRAKSTASCTTGTRLRPHCSQAATATACQWASFLSAALAFELEHAALGHQRGDAGHAQFGGFFDQPVHALVGGDARQQVHGARVLRARWRGARPPAPAHRCGPCAARWPRIRRPGRRPHR